MMGSCHREIDAEFLCSCKEFRIVELGASVGSEVLDGGDTELSDRNYGVLIRFQALQEIFGADPLQTEQSRVP